MVCCAQLKKQTPQRAPLPSPQRDGVDLAAPGFSTASNFYLLPPIEMKVAAVDDAALPHALPRLAVSCIRLI
jgi:hypothetical protein